MDATPGALTEYLLARRRIERFVAELAVERGVPVRVEVDPYTRTEKLTTMHAVALTLGNHTRILSVDHTTFLETDDFVGVFFLPQIQAAVDQLASWE